MSKSELMGKPDELAEKMKKVKEEMAEGKPQKKDQDDVRKKSSEHDVSPKLFVTGRLDRKKQKYIAKSLTIPVWLDEEIKAYCRGVDLVILNYLIKTGLERVKEAKATINVDISET